MSAATKTPMTPPRNIPIAKPGQKPRAKRVTGHHLVEGATSTLERKDRGASGQLYVTSKAYGAPIGRRLTSAASEQLTHPVPCVRRWVWPTGLDASVIAHRDADQPRRPDTPAVRGVGDRGASSPDMPRVSPCSELSESGGRQIFRRGRVLPDSSRLVIRTPGTASQR